MNCHFAGEYSDDGNFPFIKIKLDQSYIVKKVNMFNADNGPYTSLLESSTIYVGDQKCSITGERLIRNEHQNFTCQNINSAPRNMFEDNGAVDEFDGIEGDEITIQASKLGVLMVCDL